MRDIRNPLAAAVFIGLQHLGTLHLLATQQAGITRISDLHLAQHLANDHLDVLVIDLYALQAVDVLNFPHEVVG